MARSDDTEITLGTGKMVGIFFGLVALCAVFFALGFKLGKSYVVPPSATPIGCGLVRRRPAIGCEIKHDSATDRGLESCGKPDAHAG